MLTIREDHSGGVLALPPLAPEVPGLSGQSPSGGREEDWQSRAQRVLKRVLDVALVLVGLPFALPLMGAIAVAVRVGSKGPILFSQPQLGLRGRTIRPLKFRTMQEGAEARLQELLAAGGPLAEEYRLFHKFKHDPRVTPIGRFLRKSSLDELPQLFNVLWGDMSLVGPRPYLPREVEAMMGQGEAILQVPPGITGYWQVCGRNETTFQARVTMDVHYVRHWSLALDLRLFLRTFWVVIRGQGAA